jgi:hypothetical protein
MSTPKKLLVIAAIATLGCGAWSLLAGSDEPTPAESAQLLVNQIWIERMPTDERDMVRYFVAVKQSDGRVGVLGIASGWRDHSDLFLWALEEDRLSLYLGQQKRRLQLKAKAWHCDDPEGFELCLTLTDGRQTVHLYSFEGWRVDPDDAELPDALIEAAPRLADEVEDMLELDAPPRDGGSAAIEVEALPWSE